MVGEAQNLFSHHVVEKAKAWILLGDVILSKATGRQVWHTSKRSGSTYFLDNSVPFRLRDVIRMTYEPRTSVMSCPEALSLLYRQPRFMFYAVFSEVCIFSPCSFRVTK